MTEYTTKEEVGQAREKAKKAIIETCGKEIKRICDAFYYDTGLTVQNIEVVFHKSVTIDGRVDNVLVQVNIDHEIM